MMMHEFTELTGFEPSMEEYAEIEDYLMDSGIEDGFVQEEEAACTEFIPTFDGSGV